MNVSKTLALAAAAVMASNPQAEVVHVCQDGNIFLDDAKNLALHHCRTSKLPEPTAVNRKELEPFMGVAEAKAAERRATKDDRQRRRDEEEERARIAAQEAANVATDAERNATTDAGTAPEMATTGTDTDKVGFAPGVTDTERTTPEVFLNGSARQPAHVKIRKGWTMQLGEVVRHAHALSGLSVEVWNALSDEDRDKWIDDAVIALKDTPQ